MRDPLTGYHKKREEFDPEWNTYPESCIADMDPLSGTLVGGHGEDLSAAEAQDATQLALKRKVLRAQAVEVAEVARRKKFLAERGLLDLPKALAAERALSAGERAAAAGAKVFARFLSTDELADLAAAPQSWRQRAAAARPTRGAGQQPRRPGAPSTPTRR